MEESIHTNEAQHVSHDSHLSSPPEMGSFLRSGWQVPESYHKDIFPGTSSSAKGLSLGSSRADIRPRFE